MTYISKAGGWDNGPIVTSQSYCSIGPMMRPANGAVSGTAWATANKCIYVPFWLFNPFQVVKLLAHNGATVNGDIDAAVYDADGNVVISIAAAAQTGANVWQEFDVTDQWLQSEMYFWGLQSTSTTATIMSWASMQYASAAGVMEELKGSADLPTTMTPAKLTQAMSPLVGMSNRTLI